MNKSFGIAALKRAGHAFAQTALALIPAAARIEAVDWMTVLSTSALAFIVSILKSLTIGVPEAQIEERKPPDEEPNITVNAYDDYYEDGSPKRLGDVVFPPTVECDGDTCDLTPYLGDDGGEDDGDA